jgi:glycosyltransferase involved in cell wall biosynthesis
VLAALPAILFRYPGARLTIVGTGPLTDPLLEMAAQLGVGHAVTITGWQTASRLAAEFTRSDVALVPSLWPEAFGLAALEALAAGCPVVATAAGGLTDVVQHEETGLLVPPGEPAALADAVNRLLADRPLRERLSRAGRRLGRRFAMPMHAAAVEAVYREARARHHRRDGAGQLAPIGGGGRR